MSLGLGTQSRSLGVFLGFCQGGGLFRLHVMPVTALDAGAKLALESALGEKHGRFELASDTAESLVDYFVARGRGIMALPWDIDTSNEKAWETEWTRYLAAAKVEDPAEQYIFVQWLRARSAPGSGASRQGATKVALDTLTSHGVKLTAATEAALERELAASESGSEYAQCRNSRVAFRLLMNFDPSPEDEAWWDRQNSAYTTDDFGSGIDVPSRKCYKEQFKPSASGVQLLTLERALRSQQEFADWHPRKAGEFTSIGLPKAANRLTAVVSNSYTAANGVWEAQKAYLLSFFFKEFRGLGLPKDRGNASATVAMAVLIDRLGGNGRGAALTPSPTVVGDLPQLPGLGSTAVAAPQALDLRALAGLAAAGGGSSVASGSTQSTAIGSSVSSSNVTELASALLPVLLPLLKSAGATVGAVEPPPTRQGGGAKRCPFCHRPNCPMLEDATRLCMAASTALKDKKAKDAAEGAAGEGTPKKE